MLNVTNIPTFQLDKHEAMTSNKEHCIGPTNIGLGYHELSQCSLFTITKML